ncbi:ROK family transcriptional regulator [Desulfogranum mediterraneum]|uniref:ROK family transcriptional regulator n=1 Tax=Desulfogranum mediterraneum TaxID=160661 RepID=UPI000410E0B7|nr:ROK family transcriptional regulator [Desulfogranum mediterraneum]
MIKRPIALKTLNQYQILNAIRIAGAISRTEISGIIGHSRATVSNITAKMIASDLIYEKKAEGSSARGRNRVMLAINPNAAYVVGVKVSAFRVGCVVCNILAEVKSSVVMPVRTSERPVQFVADLIEEAIRHCVKEAGLSLKQISGIGIGIPGHVDNREGVSYWSPLFSRDTASLRELIRKRFRIETYVDNDTNTVTLTQLWVGKGKGINNFIVVTIEDGLGMGVVIDGELYRGSSGFAGELGHFVVSRGGRPCRCGKRGCFEAYISNFGIVNGARERCLRGDWQHDPADILSYEEVLKGAEEGVAPLVETFAQAGQYLGQAIAGLAQLFNPSKVIVTGNGVRAGKLMFTPMQEAIAENTAPDILAATEVVVHQWKDTDWSLGAACLVLEEFYKSPFDRCVAAEKMQEALGKEGAK